MLEDDRPATESGSHPHSSPVGTGPSDVLGWPGVSVEVQWHDGEALVLIVSGEIDVLTAPQLQEAIELALSNRPGALVLDLSEVTFLSSGLVAAARRGPCGSVVPATGAGSPHLTHTGLPGHADSMAEQERWNMFEWRSDRSCDVAGDRGT